MTPSLTKLVGTTSKKEEIGDPGYFPPQLFEIVTPEEDKTEDK